MKRIIAHLLSRTERIEVVQRLVDQGAFRLRGAVQEVAKRFRVSRGAVYHYLKEVRRDG